MPGRSGQPCRTEAARASLNSSCRHSRARPRLREGRILQANAVASSFRRPGRSGGRARRGDDVSRDHPWAVDRDAVPPPPRLPTSAIRPTCSVRPYPRRVDPRRRGAPVRPSPPACNASRRRGRRSRVGCGPRRRHGPHPSPRRPWRPAASLASSAPIPAAFAVASASDRRSRKCFRRRRGQRIVSRASATVASEPVAACKVRPVRRRARRRLRRFLRLPARRGGICVLREARAWRRRDATAGQNRNILV
jgi:hypothetical protein